MIIPAAQPKLEYNLAYRILGSSRLCASDADRERGGLMLNFGVTITGDARIGERVGFDETQVSMRIHG